MTFSKDQLSRLSELAGVKVKDEALFAQAFAHPAGPAGNPKKFSKSYERLEFLGDRILGLVIAEALYKKFTSEPEGKITKRFIALVRKEMLAEIARKLHFGDFIHQLNENELHLKDGDSALSDVMESFIAALYLAHGIKAAENFILTHWTPVMEGHLAPPSDAKSMLQEHLQKKGLPLPTYKMLKNTGPSNDPLFVIEVSGEGFTAAQAEGRSKKMAEHKAAQQVLDTLRQK